LACPHIVDDVDALAESLPSALDDLAAANRQDN
jgi:hypothetical protein